MKLDEAIKHCEEKSNGCSKCAKEHEQLYYPCHDCKTYRCWECNYKLELNNILGVK